MKKLYAEFDRIATDARRGFVTLAETNMLMLRAIDQFDFYGENSENYFPNKMKAYHRMYKILFELSKS